MAKDRRAKRKILTARTEATPPVWNGTQYTRVDEGRRMVRVDSLQGPEWVHGFGRWSLRIACFLMDEPAGELSLFISLGTNRERPSVGRGKQSKYWKHWLLANGCPPRSGEAMHWNVFIGKSFWARIKTSAYDREGNRKAETDVYSYIDRFEELIG